MMSPRSSTHPNKSGSALLLTLLVTSILLMVALTFSAMVRMEARAVSATAAHAQARANARLGIMMALGQLQQELGDDRRITAPADLRHPGSPRSSAVGVWESTLSEFLQEPSFARPPNYDREKERNFRGWLVSHPDHPQTQADGFVTQPIDPSNDEPLFTASRDGHALHGSWLSLQPDTGRLAWAVADEGVKARINLGEDAGARDTPDVVSAPAGPHLGLSTRLEQPAADWPRRQDKIHDLSELSFDSSYGFVSASDPPTVLSPDYTTHSRSVLADVARGGLRVDLSLAFEMSDAEYSASQWGSLDNPFRNGPAPGGEVPLFTPATSAQEPVINVKYDGRGDELRAFKTGAVPTLDHLRDHYRAYRELASNGAVSVRPQNSPWWDSAEPTVGGVSPVLNRMFQYFSLWVDPSDPDRHLQIVVTPFVVLWNPYDVPIESPAYVVHQRLDFPVGFRFRVAAGTGTYQWAQYLGGYLGRGLPTSPRSGRSLDPYFLMQLTLLGNDSTRRPIRLEPGEVRLFGPSANAPTAYNRTGSDAERTLRMKPINSPAELHFHGGFALDLKDSTGPTSSSVWSHSLAPTDTIDIRGNFARDRFHYMVTLEDGGRPLRRNPNILSEIMVYRGEGVDTDEQIIFPPSMTADTLGTPRPIALIETFNRTATDTGSLSNLLYTVNLRQRYANALLSDADFTSGPHYQTDFRVVTDFLGSGLQITPDAQRSFFGARYAPPDGRDRLSFFELPQQAPLSLGAFQHADLVDTAFAPANPFGNSWASPYLDRRNAALVLTRTTTDYQEPIINSLALYDHSFLLNHALWDRFFLSSFASGRDDGHTGLITDWLADPRSNPLRNPRMELWRGSRTSEDVEQRLTGPDRPLTAAAHLLLKGGFNINSTSEEAWRAVLSSLRAQSLSVRDWDQSESTHNSTGTSFHRLTRPMGDENDQWTGFRELDDAQIRLLAREMVAEVRARGPFLSLGEFVNRRIGRDAYSFKGALQSAIDRANLNESFRLEPFSTGPYPEPSNIEDAYTGVGLPGWLTQADILTGIGSGITARSDTFVVRAVGESASGPAGRPARVRIEAVVQRVPEWVDPVQDPETPTSILSAVNQVFGRRFVIVSYRTLDL